MTNNSSTVPTIAEQAAKELYNAGCGHVMDESEIADIIQRAIELLTAALAEKEAEYGRARWLVAEMIVIVHAGHAISPLSHCRQALCVEARELPGEVSNAYRFTEQAREGSVAP